MFLAGDDLMTQGLNEVPWSQLISRQGRGAPIDSYLADLASTDAAKRREALLTLQVTLLHQEDQAVYEATPAAVPFLVKLAASPEVQDREEILALLRDLGSFRHRDHLLGTFDAGSIQVTDHAAPFAHTERAVADGWPTYLALLDDPSAPVRAGAAVLLGIFRPEPERVVPELEAALRREATPRTEAALALALGRYGAAVPASARARLHELVAQRTGLARTCAALATVMIEGDSAPEEVFEVLEDAEASSDTKDYGFFDQGLVNDLASRLLDRHSPPASD
jgi:hypothetical protein